MPMRTADEKLLNNCLAHQEYAWEAFVDRYVSVVSHVVNHTVESQSLNLLPKQREELILTVFTKLAENDYELLRTFRQKSNLSTFLTVLARRILIANLQETQRVASLQKAANSSDNLYPTV